VVLGLAGEVAQGSVSTQSVEAGTLAIPSSTTAPAILGTFTEGSRVAAVKGSWNGSPTSFAYQWQRCSPGCSSITGATGPTYGLVSADVGSGIKITVTASNSDGSASADSATSGAVAAVAAGSPQSTAPPTISGTARQGAALSASSGSWTGSGNTYSYQWLRCSNTACSDIASATGLAYEPVASDIDETIRVRVTAANSSGTSSALSAETDVVAAGAPPSNTSKPTISGTAADNHTVTAGTGSWSGDTPMTFGYQWQRCNSGGGSCSALNGITGKTYEVRSSDEGHTLRVLVTASNSAGSSTALSDPVTVSRPAKPTNTALPTISGTPADNHTLTARTGSWSSETSIAFSYQWERCNSSGGSCEKLAGQSKQTYEVTSSDVGHSLRVLVTASNSGGSSTASSGPVVVQPTKPTNTSPPTISGNLAPGQSLTANPGAWTGTPTISYTYTWVRCNSKGKSCKAVGWTRTFPLTAADVGQRIFVRARARNAYGASEAHSALTPVVQPDAPVSTSRPAVSGMTRQGEALKATTGGWSSAAALAFYYQWARCDSGGTNCRPIGGATKSNYVLTVADVGHRLIVQVKAQNSRGAGYANSIPTNIVAAARPVPAAKPPLRPTGSVPVGSVSLPDRLVIDQVRFAPSRIRSRRQPLVARFHVRETRGGKSVSGALVYAVAVPFNRLSAASEVTTDGSGWATVSFRVLPTFPLKKGYLVVMFVRARKPGGTPLAGISTRRLVSVRVG
jgi:hypothetical protein